LELKNKSSSKRRSSGNTAIKSWHASLDEINSSRRSKRRSSGGSSISNTFDLNRNISQNNLAGSEKINDKKDIVKNDASIVKSESSSRLEMKTLTTTTTTMSGGVHISSTTLFDKEKYKASKLVRSPSVSSMINRKSFSLGDQSNVIKTPRRVSFQDFSEASTADCNASEAILLNNNKKQEESAEYGYELYCSENQATEKLIENSNVSVSDMKSIEKLSIAIPPLDFMQKISKVNATSTTQLNPDFKKKISIIVQTNDGKMNLFDDAVQQQIIEKLPFISQLGKYSSEQQVKSANALLAIHSNAMLVLPQHDENTKDAAFSTDVDLLQLRIHINEDFSVAFERGLEFYIRGEWDKAKTFLEKSNELMKLSKRSILNGDLSSSVPLLLAAFFKINNEKNGNYLVNNDSEKTIGKFFDEKKSIEKNRVLEDGDDFDFEICDGPSMIILNYMKNKNFKAPDDWKGFRTLTLK
jgi:hypothetical protein